MEHQTTNNAGTLADNTPILVGGGQHVEHIQSDSRPPFASPADLAAKASEAALSATGVANLAEHIDTIAMVRLFSDTVPAWKSPFGASNNLPESLAQRIGAPPGDRIYSNAGGTEPLLLLIEMAQAIARGDKSVVLLSGAEAIAYQKYGRRNNLESDWEEHHEAELDNRLYLKRFAAPEELRSGMTTPAHYYSLIENAQAEELGHNTRQHQHFIGELFAPFTDVAASNPYAQFPHAQTAEQIATATPDNYLLCLPYTKAMVAQDAVNQAATVVLTSVGKARALGIPPENWIHLHGFASATDNVLIARPNPGRSAALEAVMTETLSMAETSIDQIDILDIYSCFPCAVTAVSDALNTKTSETRPLTVTGGLPFFGGPGNNYSMHALAEMALSLRSARARGLITANGGQLSKHAAVVLSDQAEMPSGHQLAWPIEDSVALGEADFPAQPLCAEPHVGTVISYTLIYNRNSAALAVVLAKTDKNERFLASSTEADILASLERGSPIGRAIDITTDEEQHHFTFAGAD